MDGVGPATESRDCVPVRGRRPAGRLGAARVAACELGRLAPLPHLCRPLNWYMPAAVQPAAAVLATAGEVIFAIALITGFRLREAAIGSGVLLTIFGISMALTLGMKAPLDYSVFTAATAAFSLAVMAADHKRENPRGRKS